MGPNQINQTLNPVTENGHGSCLSGARGGCNCPIQCSPEEGTREFGGGARSDSEIRNLNAQQSSAQPHTQDNQPQVPNAQRHTAEPQNGGLTADGVQNSQPPQPRNVGQGSR
jgi:hypothetical protein